jgi:hypothetical protein
MSLENELRQLFGRTEDAPWPGELTAFDRFLRRKARRGRAMAAGVALTLAAIVGAAVLIPRVPAKNMEPVVPLAPRSTGMRIADQGFQLVAPAGWKISRTLRGQSPAPSVRGVMLVPSRTPHGASITVSTDDHEPDWQGASKRPDGRSYLLRPRPNEIGQYVIQWPNYCSQYLFGSCTRVAQARVLLVTGAGGGAGVREQVTQAMQQITASVQPITNALVPPPTPTVSPQTKVLLGTGGTGRAAWEAWIEPQDNKPGFAVHLPTAALEPQTHWEQLAPSILQHQGTYTYTVCLSRLPDSGVVLIGLAREDTATVQIELSKRPLVQVPVFGRDQPVPMVAFASPRLPADVLVNRVTAFDAAGRMIGSENRGGTPPCANYNEPFRGPRRP